MAKKRYTVEQIIRHLREAEVELAKGQTTGVVCRKLGITEQTYYRWRKEYGSLRVDQVRRLKELERENGRIDGGWNLVPPRMIPGSFGLQTPDSCRLPSAVLRRSFALTMPSPLSMVQKAPVRSLLTRPSFCTSLSE